jgi:hypothetical protein
MQDDRGLAVQVPIVAGISYFHVVQTGLGPNAGSLLKLKRPGRETVHLPTSTVVKNMDLYTHSPIRLHGVMLT